jgi:HK97 family phage portal protein
MGRLVDSVRSFWMEERPSKDPELARYFGYTPVASGVSVTETTALNYSAYWAGVRRISSDVASLPLDLFKRVGDSGRTKFRDHPLYWLLHSEFNPLQTSVVARQMMQAHVLTWGNAYAWIERNQAGRPIAVWPLTPDRVVPELRTLETLVYRVKQKTGADLIITADDILHIPGLGFDGIQGYSVVQKARESLGLGLASERFGAKFFGNGAWPGLVAQHPGRLSDKAATNLKDSIQKAIGGLENAHGIFVTEEGIKVDKLGIPPNDAQFLETRQFQVVEICRWLMIPPHKLYEMERATFSNIEHQAIEYVQDTLVPWITIWEAELEKKLIADLEQGIQFIEFNVEGKLRGDFNSRMNGHAVGIQWGFMNRDEVREKENLNPMPDGLGKVFLAPANMVAAEAIPTEPPPAPKPVAPAASNGNGNQTMPMQQPAQPKARALAEIIAANRTAFIEQAARMVRKEAQAARRVARKGPMAMRKWIADFYPKHATVFADAIGPALRVHLAQVESDKDPMEETQALVAVYIDESRTQIERLLSTAPAELENVIDAQVSRWESERPKELADIVLLEEVTHAIADHA